MDGIERVAATDAALALLARLQAAHGAVFFVLSHGCCDGSTPMCLAPGEMTLSPTDVCLGTVGGAGFWVGAGQQAGLDGLHLTLDLASGSNGGFSLEDGSGQRFVLRERPGTGDAACRPAAQGGG